MGNGCIIGLQCTCMLQAQILMFQSSTCTSRAQCPYFAFNLDHGGPQLPGIQPYIMTTNLCLHRSIHIFNKRFCPHEGLFVVILRIFLSGATMYGPPNPKLQGHNNNTTLNKEHFNSEHFCGCCDTCTSLKQLTNITDNMLITRQDKVREAF